MWARTLRVPLFWLFGTGDRAVGLPRAEDLQGKGTVLYQLMFILKTSLLVLC